MWKEFTEDFFPASRSFVLLLSLRNSGVDTQEAELLNIILGQTETNTYQTKNSLYLLETLYFYNNRSFPDYINHSDYFLQSSWFHEDRGT